MRKKIITYLCLQCIAILCITGIAWEIGTFKAFLILFICMEAIFLVLVYQVIAKPLGSTEKELSAALELKNPLEYLDNLDLESPYIEQIKLLAEKCSEERSRKNSAEIFDNQAQITALQSQINPHFLYNTLESVRGQALLDGNEEIAKMMEALSAFFRYSISRKGSLATLREELANIQNYMMIQRYRFNNRFSLEIYIDEEDEAAYDYKIPKLIIQPVVENAVFHGLEERLEGGKVIIEIIVTKEHLIITVSDNGQGMEGKALAELNARIHSGYMRAEEKESGKPTNTGIGLPNIHRRIQLLFGEEFGLSVYSTLNQGTDVEITVPSHYERDVRQR